MAKEIDLFRALLGGAQQNSVEQPEDRPIKTDPAAPQADGGGGGSGFSLGRVFEALVDGYHIASGEAPPYKSRRAAKAAARLKTRFMDDPAAAIRETYASGNIALADDMYKTWKEQENIDHDNRVNAETLYNNKFKAGVTYASSLYGGVKDEETFRKADEMVRRYFRSHGLKEDVLPNTLSEAEYFSMAEYTPEERDEQYRKNRGTDNLITHRNETREETARHHRATEQQGWTRISDARKRASSRKKSDRASGLADPQNIGDSVTFVQDGRKIMLVSRDGQNWSELQTGETLTSVLQELRDEGLLD